MSKGPVQGATKPDCEKLLAEQILRDGSAVNFVKSMKVDKGKRKEDEVLGESSQVGAAKAKRGSLFVCFAQPSVSE